MAWIELHQGLREHRKLFACVDDLKVSRMQLIGMLVSMWLWALDNAPSGSLAGISNKTIARVCDFPEKKADQLVSSLHKTGWLDKDGDAFVIHDWFDYAGKLMERRDKDRERKKTKQKTERKISDGIPSEGTRNSCATVPNRTVPNHTEPLSSSATAEEDNAAAAAKAKFDQFWEKYPNKVGRSEALSAWIDLFYGEVKPANVPSISAILAGLELWITSAEWAKEDGRFIPRPANWLSGRRWEESPPQSQTIPKGASGQLGQAELDAIKKMFAKE